MSRLATAIALALALPSSALGAEPASSTGAVTPSVPTETTVSPPRVDSPRNEMESMPPEGELLKLEGQPEAELLVNVELTGNDHSARYEVRSTLSDSTLLICYDVCTFRIWPGRYRLLTRASHGIVQSEELILVDRDSRITVKAAPLIESITGAVLTVIGTTALILGGYYFKQSTCDEACHNDTARDNRKGTALLLGGAVMVPAGVLLLGHGFFPEVTLNPADSSFGSRSNRVAKRAEPRLTWSVLF